jgi:hypothetical protein
MQHVAGTKVVSSGPIVQSRYFATCLPVGTSGGGGLGAIVGDEYCDVEQTQRAVRE